MTGAPNTPSDPARASEVRARDPGRGASAALLGLAALASGAAALAYEVLWVRHLGLVLGSTAYAVNLVLAVFFLGLGVGARAFGRVADRRRGAIGLFCALELAIAAWGVAFWPLSTALESLWVALAPAEWPLARSLPAQGIGAAFLLAVPTLAMGGTLPALLRHAVRARGELGTRVGWLYGANTVGAALGALAAVFVLIPRFGMRGAALCAVLGNGAAIGLAWLGRARDTALDEPERAPTAVRTASAMRATESPTESPTESHGRGATRLVLVAAAWSGFVSVGLEVLWTRALSQRFMSTVYSFALLLFVFLACLGLGSLLASALARVGAAGRTAAALAMACAGLAALASAVWLSHLGEVALPAYLASEAGADFARFQWRELRQALTVMALPTLLFGLELPLLVRLAHREVASVGGELGAVYLANTAGSVAAPLAFGFVLMPWLGLDGALFAASWGAIAFGALVLLPWARGASGLVALTVVAATAGGALLQSRAGEVRLWREDPGDVLLFYEESAAAGIAVVAKREGADTVHLLKIDNSYRLGATRSFYSQERQGLIPLLLARDPESALFLGLGTGSSAAAAAAWSEVAVDVLEIVPGLGDLLPYFASPRANLAMELRERGDVRLLEVDARHFIRTTPRRYDVVVGDLFVPWRAGEGGMYTREHLEAVRDVLADDGLFCQWLPLYQLGPEDLKTIARTFVDVFPQVEAFWLYFNAAQPAIALVASKRPLALDPERVARAAADPMRADLMRGAGLSDAREWLGSFIASRAEIAAWAGVGELETRDRALIEFRAPRHRLATKGSLASQNVPLVCGLAESASPASLDRLLVPLTPEVRAEIGAYRDAITAAMRGRLKVEVEQDDEGALPWLARAVENAPEWGWPAVNLGQILERARAKDDADLERRAVEALLVSRHRYAAMGFYRAAERARADGDTETAERLLEQALERDPDHAEARRLIRLVRIER